MGPVIGHYHGDIGCGPILFTAGVLFLVLGPMVFTHTAEVHAIPDPHLVGIPQVGISPELWSLASTVAISATLTVFVLLTMALVRLWWTAPAEPEPPPPAPADPDAHPWITYHEPEEGADKKGFRQ